jgi:uncharacterized membrane protein
VSTEPTPEISQDGRTWAYVAYASMFVGFPLFLVPMLQRNDAFALFHAKQAAVAYIAMIALFFAYGFISIITCGFGAVLFPMVLLPYVPMIHGVLLVSNGEWKEPIGVFGLGNTLFAGVQLQGPQQGG